MIVGCSMISGDPKKFKENKQKILTDLMTLFSRMIRTPEKFTSQIVFEVLSCVSSFAIYVNVELMAEIFDELRRIVVDLWADAEGPVVFGAIMAAINLMEKFPAKLPAEVRPAQEVATHSLRLILVGLGME